MHQFLSDPMPDNLRKAMMRLDESDPKVAKMSNACARFARRYALNDRSVGTWLVLAGQTGSGKTHAARRVHHFATAYAIDIRTSGNWNHVRNGLNPTFLDWSDVCAADKEAGFDKFMEDNVADATLVILDDIGSETDKFKDGSRSDRLRRFLSACERKWLLITTNASRAALGSVYDARVMDRLNQSHWLDLTGVKSFRGANQ